MATVQATARPKENPFGLQATFSSLLRILVLITVDISAAWFIAQTITLGFIPFTVVLIVVMLMVNVVVLLERFSPIRWMVLGLSFMVIFVIYPIFFTVYVAFTNYGDGHLVTEEQALRQILSRTYLPEEGRAFAWTAFRSPENEYALWLIDTNGRGLLAVPGEEIREVAPGEDGVGELDANGIPVTLEGYTRLNAILAATDQNLSNILFGDEPTVQVRSPSEAAELLPRYEYDEVTDTVFDKQTETVFTNINGTFTSASGATLTPGFRAVIGWENFTQFFTSPSLRGPLVRILVWNFVFPILSVVSTFALGLAIAIMFNESGFPFKRTIRSFLLIPYTIPGLITIIIWRGMMNTELGVINRTLMNWFSVSVPWTTDGNWAKFAVLLVNLWLGYPYFMLICSGALQAIPSDLYEAAEVDGASIWQRFRTITLPLLLVAVGPLLIASYVFNFNNFNLIYLFIQGGPPIANATAQAGHTDILISYVYKMAFEGSGRGVQYGLASAITIVIFFVVGALTLFQFRFTNMWEEVSENV
ncbi:MAG: ABC transporter permease subunit [Anaerolinea sp.]|nr:ABC transporter permease subunit [Anaerolinea sp.]